MPFSVSSPTSDALARRKKQDRELFDASMRASALGVDALQGLERTLGEQEARARQRGLDEVTVQQLVETNRRADEASRLALRAANERTAREGRQEELNLRKLRMLEASAEEKARSTAAAEAERTRAASVIEPAKVELMQAQAERARRRPTSKAPSADEVRRATALADIAEVHATQAKSGSKETAQQKNRQQALSTASGIVDDAISSFEKYQEETVLPSSGALEGFRDIPGVSSFTSPESRVRFKGDIAALSAMLFPLIGRSDAPTDIEVKSLLNLAVSSTSPEHVTRARLKRIKELIDGGTIGQSAPFGEIVPRPAAAPLGDTVRVTNGKETLRIPRARLVEAVRDGFREVP